MYEECTIISEVWRPFKKLEAVFESFFDYEAWGI